MADFDDLPIDDPSPAPEPPPLLLPPPEPEGPTLWPILAVVGLVAVLGAGWYLTARNPAAPKPVATGVEQTTVDLPKPVARRAPEPGDPIDLPPLDQTDPLIRTLLGALSSHPTVAAWLTTDGLVRNFAVAINSVAEGETPAKGLKPIRPTGSFVTRSASGSTYIDPSSYHRYDAIAAAVDSIDPRGAARLYATVKPRVADAYHELIGPQADVDQALERAIVMLLKTPVVDGDVAVTTEKLSYRYANPQLEELSKAQRQFLRMGPQNMRVVKAKLRAIAGYLGIPDGSLPPPDKP